MLKIYGTVMSRAVRALWAAEELGIPYDLIATDPGTGSRSSEFLKINPNGHVPAIDDNGLIVWESMAINLYLAEKYGQGTLWPSDIADHAHIYQWSFWALSEVEEPVMTAIMNKMFLPEEERDAAKAQDAIKRLEVPFGILDRHLQGRETILGKQYTIADLNVCSVVDFAMYIPYDFSPYPALNNWLMAGMNRPAHQKVLGLLQG